MDENSFKSYMGRYRFRIEESLEEFFDSEIQKTLKISSVAEETFQKLREYTLRKAKRIRPILVVIGANAFKKFNREEEAEIIKAALSIELMQSFLLIHDDIIDKSDTRRGKPAFHKTYKNKEYGINQGICSGDAACILGYKLISQTRLNDEIKIKLIEKMNDIVLKTIHGEMLDISFENRNITEISEDEIVKELSLKTSNYTIAGPLQLGALIAGLDNSKEDYNLLDAFGQKLGLAFQIHDDILGIFGTESDLGKPVTSDIEEGKKTVLIKRTLDNLDSGADKNTLLKLYGQKITKKVDYEKVKSIIEKSGGLDDTKKYAEALVKEAMDILGKINMNDSEKEFLASLCEYIIKRND